MSSSLSRHLPHGSAGSLEGLSLLSSLFCDLLTARLGDDGGDALGLGPAFFLETCLFAFLLHWPRGGIIKKFFIALPDLRRVAWHLL